MSGQDIGYYTLPVIVSMQGVDAQINSKLGKGFGNIGAKASKDFGTGFASNLKIAEAAYEKLADKAKDSLGKVRTAEAQLQSLRDRGITDAGRIAVAEEKVATARRNSVRATKEAEAAHSALGRSQDNLNTKVGSSGRALTGLSGILDGISGRLGGVSGRFASFGSRMSSGMAGIETGGSKAALAVTGIGVAAGAAVVGVAALGAAAVVVGKQFYDMGAKFDDVADNIMIKTGKSGAALAELTSAAERVSTTTASSLADIGEVTVDVSRAFDIPVDSAMFDSIVSNVANLQRMTGEKLDMPELNKVFNAWGVGADEAVPALNKLFQASRNTGKPINEMLPILTKYGSTLRSINPDIGVAAGLMTELTAAGLEDSVALKALQTANSEFAESGRTMNQGLTETFDAIKSLDDQKALALGEKIFGEKGGANMVEAIREGRLSLQDLTRATETTGLSIEDTAAQTEDWSEKWTKFKNKMDVGLKPISTAVFDTVNDKLDQLATWVDTHRDEVILFFGKVADVAIGAAQGILTFSSMALRGLAGMVDSFVDSIKPFFDWAARIGTVMSVLPGDAGKVGRALKTAGEGGQNLTEKLKGAPGVLRGAADRLDGINAGLGAAREGTKDWFAQLAESQKLTGALGTDVHAIATEAGEIEINAEPNDETKKRLDDLHLKVEKIDGKFVITAKTDAGQKTIDSWKSKNEKKPVETKTTTDTRPAEIQVKELNKTAETVLSEPKPLMLDTGPARNFGVAVALGMPSTAFVGGVMPASQAVEQVAKALNTLGKAVKVKLDTGPAGKDMDEFLKKYPILDPNNRTTIDVNGNLMGPLLSPLPTAPGGGPAGGGSANPEKLTPNAAAIMAEVHKAYPSMDIWGWANRPPSNEHPSGHALDLMTLDNPAGLALGDGLVGHYLKDPRVKYIIWKNQMWYPGKPPTPYGHDPKDRNGAHFTHPHLHLKQKGGGIPGYGGGDRIPALLEGGEHIFDKDDVMAMGGHENVLAFRKALHFSEGGRVPDWDAIAQKESGGRWNLPYGDRDSTGGLQIRKRTWDDFGGPALTGKEFPYQATKEQQIAIAERILAKQGPQAWAGGANFVWKDSSAGGAASVDISVNTRPLAAGSGYTAGTGPGGEAGYYAPPNPSDVTSAEEDVNRAESALNTAKANLETVQADTEATEAQKVAAMAERDNAQAELDKANAKLAAVKKGVFTAGDLPEDPFPGWQNVAAEATDIADAVAKVTAAQGKLNTALAKRKDMDSTPIGETPPTDEQKAAQDREIARLREELRLEEEHEANVRRGTYKQSETKDTKTEKTEYDSEIEKIGQLPGTLVNGLLESIGIGDIFPDLTQTPAWKSIAAGITAFKGPIQGWANGKLGIQQPGWSPGMAIPVSGAEVPSGGGGVPMPFGLPDIALPAPAPTDVHQGSGGAPGPVSQDNSVNIQYNGNVGSYQEEFAAQRRTIESRSIPNIPVGS